MLLTAALLVLAGFATAALRTTTTHPRGAAKGGAPGRTGGPSGVAGRAPHTRAQAVRSLFAQRENAAIDATLRYTPVITSGSRRRREVALTFDDGPSQYTAAIMRVLQRKRAPATFFIVGQQLNRFGSRLGDELRQSFPVGDHTEDHAWLPRLDRRGQAREIGDVAIRIGRAAGTTPRLFRPPYGAFNATTLGVLGRRRMLLVLWSVDPQDWRRPGVGWIVSTVLRRTAPGGIVLMHDGGGYRDQTVAALPSIIDGLRRRHFQLVTVPRLILDDPPPRHAQLPPFSGG